MSSEERKLRQASVSLKLLRQVSKKADEILSSKPEELKKVKSKIDELIKIFEPYDSKLKNIQEENKRRQKKLEEICAKEGHVGEWTANERSKQIWMGDLGSQQLVWWDYTVYTRTCTRCGKTEETEDKPKEIIEEEKRKEIAALKAKVKKLESELD